MSVGLIYLKLCSQFYLSGLTLSDRSLQVENNTNSIWDSIKGDHNRLIEVKIISIKGKEFRDFDRVIQGGRWKEVPQ